LNDSTYPKDKELQVHYSGEDISASFNTTLKEVYSEPEHVLFDPYSVNLNSYRGNIRMVKLAKDEWYGVEQTGIGSWKISHDVKPPEDWNYTWSNNTAPTIDDPENLSVDSIDKAGEPDA
jgi:hypothetical protein